MDTEKEVDHEAEGGREHDGEEREHERAAGFDALVDALPYVDGYSGHDRELALNLIEKEMKTFEPKDYLAHLPPAPELKFGGSPALKAEFLRMGKKEPMQPIDPRRYTLIQPAPNEKNDLEAWQNAVNHAQTQYEHQGLRVMNLGLLNEYGANAWLAHNKTLEETHKRLQGELQTTRKEIEDTNRTRKIEQISAGESLRTLEQKWVGHIYKNLEIEQACLEVEQEMKDMAKENNEEGEGQ